MFRQKHLRLRHATVLTLAVLLALVSVGLITTLHGRAASYRAAQLKLSNVNVTLNELVPIAYSGSRALGGSPEGARTELRAAERSIDAALAQLRRDHPNPWLDRVRPPLRSEYALLEQIRVHAAAGDMQAAIAVGPPVEITLRRVTAMVRNASADYEGQASVSLTRATMGSAAVILVLLAGFALFYRRSWVLLAKNLSLLDTSRFEAQTDVLTGLGNRRALMTRLQQVMPAAAADRRGRWVLVLLDLDGFKYYNDSFGHPAGDALLARLGDRLRETVAGIGTAFRMGGDEFCVLAEVGDGDGEGVARLAAAALSESGKSFHISCSYGLALLPVEASSRESALGLADRRMYRQKGTRRAAADGHAPDARDLATVSTGRQITDVLLRVLGERDPELEEHLDDVGRLAQQMAERIGLPTEAVDKIRLAGQLHDVGKTAIPDSILTKAGPLNQAEWEFMRRHTLIGERIILAAPALEHTAALVRSSHERVDGTGYPDQLRGNEIPVGARIIAICDAFDAMVTQRPYGDAMSEREAMGELRRGAGSQFDAALVTVFEQLVDDLEQGAIAGKGSPGTKVGP